MKNQTKNFSSICTKIEFARYNVAKNEVNKIDFARYAQNSARYNRVSHTKIVPCTFCTNIRKGIIAFLAKFPP